MFCCGHTDLIGEQKGVKQGVKDVEFSKERKDGRYGKH